MRNRGASSVTRRGSALGAALAVALALFATTAPLRAEDPASSPPAVGAPSDTLAPGSGPDTGAPGGPDGANSGAKGNDDGLVPPPVVDPKPVETRPVTPGARHPFVREEELSPVPVLSLAGTAKWDDAYDTLVGAIKALDAELKVLGLKRAGDVMVVYSQGDDERFAYEVQMPFSGVTTKKPSGGMKLGGSYAGKVLRFSHSGAFTDMDNTYELIANYLDEKNINADESYMEEYRTDLVTTPPDALKIDILVPLP